MKIREESFGQATVGVPINWTDNSVINFVGPPAGEGQPNLVITRRKLLGNPTIDRFVEHQKKFLEESELPGYEFIDEGPVVHGEQRFHRVSFSWLGLEAIDDPSKGVRLRQDQYYLIKGQESLTLTLTCPSDSFEELRPIFEQIVEHTRLD